MTIKQLKDGVLALAKKTAPARSSVTLQERLLLEYQRGYTQGYNKAIVDVMVVIEQMKKEQQAVQATQTQS